MFKLNLGFDNERLYKGCKITEFEKNRYRLDTPTDSATVILAANLLELLKEIPEADRDRLVITGAVPPAILLTAQSVMGPFFRQIEFFDGRKGETVEIPQPPPDFESEPE